VEHSDLTGKDGEKKPSWRDEVLFDAHITHPALNAGQQRMLDLLTRTVAGGMVAWIGCTELMREIREFQEYRNRRGYYER